MTITAAPGVTNELMDRFMEDVLQGRVKIPTVNGEFVLWDKIT